MFQPNFTNFVHQINSISTRSKRFLRLLLKNISHWTEFGGRGNFQLSQAKIVSNARRNYC